MSFEDTIELTDPAAMRALAHPVRLSLIHHLLDVEDATATECAEHIGESPSNCSYHLRTLERYGFVAGVVSQDAREHRWTLVVRGFDLAEDTPQQRAAAAALNDEMLRQDEMVAQRFARERSAFPAEWQRAAGTLFRGTIHLTASELDGLTPEFHRLLAPFVDREGARNWPDEAKRVRVVVRATPWPSD